MDDPLDDFENKYFFHDVIEYESECHIAILNQFFLCFFILTNDDEVCIPSLSSILLVVMKDKKTALVWGTKLGT